jgi:hypothetical protein
MNGPLAQLVAFTSHANAMLAGASVKIFPDNSSCQFCEFVHFIRPRRWFFKTTPVIIADDPDGWFALLRRQGARGVKLRLRDTSGSGHLEALMRDGQIERWMACWEVGTRGRPDRRIWHVEYRLGTESIPAAPPLDLDTATAKLKTALVRIQNFAYHKNLQSFAETFGIALRKLAGESAPKSYHQDLQVEGYIPSRAVTLLDTLQTAWVFGGMGSWNDMSFQGPDEPEYNSVTDQLWDALQDATMAAANSGLRT